MFCKACGELNKDHSNYCTNDGASLKNNKKLKMKKMQIRFCGGCGDKIDATDSYCNNCGTSFFEVQRVARKIIPNIGSNPSDASSIRNAGTRSSQSLDLGYFDFKRIVKYGAISFGVLIILSLALSAFANEAIKMMIASETGMQYSEIRYMAKGFKVVNFLDLTLLSNQSGLMLSADAGYGASGDLILKGGLHMLMLIPALVFIVLGIIRAKSDLKNGEQFNLANIVGTSVIYTLLLIIVALVSKKSMYLPLNMIAEESINLYKKFNVGSIIFAGLFISNFFTFVGYALYGKLKKRHDLFGNFGHVLEGSFNFTLILALMPIFVTILFGIYLDSEPFYDQFGIAMLMILFISPFVHLLMNFGVLNMFAMDYYSGATDVSMSLFNLVFLKEELFYYMDKSSFFVYLGIIISAIVLFISGRNMTKKYGSSIKNILYTSAAYSVIAILFSFIIKISFNINGSVLFFSADDLGSATIAFNFFSVLFGTFIMSVLFMFLGSKFSGSKE